MDDTATAFRQLAEATGAIADELEQQPTPPPAAGTMPGTIPFTAFSGTDDSARVTDLNKWAKEQRGVTHPVLFTDEVVTKVPFKLYSGFKATSPGGLPAREYGRAPTVHYDGPAGTSLFQFLDLAQEQQTGQSYPGDGSPRDGSWAGIQFSGRRGTHWMPKLDPSKYRGTTLWYWNFHNCGWKGFDTIWWGAGTGTTITGTAHVQDIADTWLWLGGSECKIFSDGYSMVGLPSASPMVGSGKPLIRSSLAKSFIGTVMATGRKDIYPLLIDGGYCTHVHGFASDAQDSDPMFGTAVRITGGEAHLVTGGVFKGSGAAPDRAAGGLGNNRGWIMVTGGSDHVIDGNAFRRLGGPSPAAVDWPVVYVGGSAKRVKVGLNGFSGWGDAQPVVQQSAAGKVHVLDPTVKVTTG